MEPIDGLECVEAEILQNPLLVLYFTGSACGACEVIKEKVTSILKAHPEVRGIEVNGEKFPEVATSYDVYTLPLMILFVEGKESMRVGRNINLLDFENRLVRYIEMLN